ncbi:MAG: tryptophan--tRNA ligase, partial [Oligoflexia bacterium]|nr:tryptophan--tRNA ligase [Oligoflexia bacterium]
MTQPRRTLTGIKPSGELHLGNYLAALKPVLELADSGYEAFCFIANYHAITLPIRAEDLSENTYTHIANWLAFGADKKKGVVFYLQSDIPEIFELTWILSCYTSKGLLDRSHAYKDAISKNKKAVNLGLYAYPVLMAADILAFDTDVVPVGKDQKQHVEIARDIAGAFNFEYKEDVLRLPEPLIRENVKTVPGVDGEKMSKSYNNIIPVFAEPDKIRKLVAKIKTDSSLPGDPKDPGKCIIFSIYKLFAQDSDVEDLRKRYISGGLGWKDAKALL